MNVNPRQYDPEFQDPNAADSERNSQFGMQSQADMPLTAGATNAPVWGQRDVLASAPVYGSDDKKIGTVQESYKDSFKVKSGILITHDLYYPYSTIARSDPERIVLNLTSDEAKQENWRQRPSPDAADMTGTTSMGGTNDLTGMGATAAGGMTGGAMTGPAAGTSAETAPETAPMPPRTTGEYGIYGPEGSEDTMQSATERGAHPDDTPDDTAAPMQGDMVYRGTMGPNNEPGAPDRAYNPGLQGTGTSGQEDESGRLAPEQDPTSWNADQPSPNTGS